MPDPTIDVTSSNPADFNLPSPQEVHFNNAVAQGAQLDDQIKMLAGQNQERQIALINAAAKAKLDPTQTSGNPDDLTWLGKFNTATRKNNAFEIAQKYPLVGKLIQDPRYAPATYDDTPILGALEQQEKSRKAIDNALNNKGDNIGLAEDIAYKVRANAQSLFLPLAAGVAEVDRQIYGDNPLTDFWYQVHDQVKNESQAYAQASKGTVGGLPIQSLAGDVLAAPFDLGMWFGGGIATKVASVARAASPTLRAIAAIRAPFQAPVTQLSSKLPQAAEKAAQALTAVGITAGGDTFVRSIEPDVNRNLATTENGYLSATDHLLNFANAAFTGFMEFKVGAIGEHSSMALTKPTVREVLTHHIPVEAASEAAQNVVGQITDNAKEGKLPSLGDLVYSAAAGGLGGGLISSSALLNTRISKEFSQPLADIINQTKAHEVLANQIALTKSSQLKERIPSQIAAVVKELGLNGNVYFKADEWNTALTGMGLNPDDMLTTMNGKTTASGLISIPHANYIQTAVNNEPLDRVLRDVVKINPGGASLKELTASFAEVRKNTEAIQEQIRTEAKHPTLDGKVEDNSAMIAANIEQQFVNTGNKDMVAGAKNAGTIVGEFYRSMAHTWNAESDAKLTPLDVFKQYPLSVETGAATGTRGQYDLQNMKILTGKMSDPSTIIHELGHHFREVFSKLAANNKAPVKFKEMDVSIESWLQDNEAEVVKSYLDRIENSAQRARAYDVLKRPGVLSGKPAGEYALTIGKNGPTKATEDTRRATSRDISPTWESLGQKTPIGKPGVTQEDALGVDWEHIFIYRSPEGIPIGKLVLFDPKDTYGAYLSVAVKPEFRRQGIASKLYAAASNAGYDVEAYSNGSGNVQSPEGAAFKQARATNPKAIGQDTINIADKNANIISDAKHEYFARGFEKWFATGKAPSSKIAKAFVYFAKWLRNIYGAIFDKNHIDSLDVTLDPRSNAFMAQLISITDSQEAAEVSQHIDEMLKASADEFGIDSKQYQRLDDAIDENREKVIQEIVKTEAGKLSEAAIKEREDYRNAIEPNVRKQFMDPSTPDGQINVAIDNLKASPLDANASKELFSTATLAELKRLKLLKEDGKDPIEMASLLGFETPAAMGDAIAGILPFEKQVKVAVGSKVLEQFGPLPDNASIRQTVEKNLFSGDRQKVLAVELATIIGARSIADQGLSEDLASDMYHAMRASKDTINHERQVVQTIAMTDMSPRTWRTAAQREHIEAIKAFRTGDRAKAIKSILGAIAATARAQFETEAIARHKNDVMAIKAMSHNKALREKLKSGGDWHIITPDGQTIRYDTEAEAKRDYNVAAKGSRLVRISRAETLFDGILQLYDLRSLNKQDIEFNKAIRAAYLQMQNNGEDTGVTSTQLDDILRPSSNELSVSETADILFALKSIVKTHSDRNTMLKMQAGKEADKLFAELVGIAEKNAPSKPPSDTGIAHSLYSPIDTLLDSTTRLSTRFNRYDGGTIGSWAKSLMMPLQDAVIFFRDMENKAADRQMKNISRFSQIENWSMRAKKSYQIAPNRNMDLSRWDIMAIAAHWGSESGQRAIRASFGLPKEMTSIDDAASIQTILNTMTPKEVAYVHDVWAQYAELIQQLGDVYSRRGEAPISWIKANPYIADIDGKPVSMRGGYYPIKRVAERNVDITDDVLSNNVRAMINPNEGFTEDRTPDAAGNIDLTPESHIQSINSRLRVIAFSELARDWTKTVKAIAPDMIRLYGKEDWNRSVRAVNYAFVGTKDVQAFDRLMGSMRSNLSFSMLAASGWSAIQQPIGLANSAAIVGEARLAKWGMKYALDYGAIRKSVQSMHPGMAERFANQDANMVDVTNATSSLSIPALRKWKQWGMAPIAFMQQHVDAITYMAAYDMHSQTMDAATAAKAAYQTVLDSQGSALPTEISAVQRNELGKLMTMFATPAITMVNQHKVALQAIGRAKGPAAMALALLNMSRVHWWTVAFPILIGMWLHKWKGGDEQSDDSFKMKMLKGEIKSMLDTVPLLRDASTSITENYGHVQPPVWAEVEKLASFGKSALTKDEDTKWRDGIMGSMIVAPLPGNEAGRVYDALQNYKWNSADFWQTVLFGKEHK